MEAVSNKQIMHEKNSQKLLPIEEEYKTEDEAHYESASFFLDDDHPWRGIQTDELMNHGDFINNSNMPDVLEELKMNKSITDENDQLFQQLLSFKDQNIFFKLEDMNQTNDELQWMNLESADDKTLAEIYKRKFLMAINLSESLKNEIENYKKMGKIVQFLSGNKMSADELKEELTDDLKLIIADLKEHIDGKETEEMQFVKENLKRLLASIDPKYAKEIEEILEKLSSSKASKQSALKEFTDKIITTVEDIEENHNDM